ncbi:MAG: hypothetical protein C0501_17430 [Isosphaera sp.]|nr:hypothetical protein [Isosphaera sp.]
MPLDTLANVKTALMISGTTDDAVLTRLLDAADGFVAGHTGRDFAGGAFTETHPGGRNLAFLRNYPVASVTSLKVDALRQFGAGTERAADTFVVHADRGVVECVGGPFLRPRFGRRDDWPGAVQVAYTTATGQVPWAVREAFTQLVGHWYRFTKTAVDQSYSMLVTKIDGTTEKTWPWGLAGGEPLPPVVLQLLQPYRIPAA